MINKMKKLFIIFLLAGFVNAFTIDEGVFDLNTKEGIFNASVLLMNDTDVINSSLTNAYGYCSLAGNPLNMVYSIQISAPGYYLYAYSQNITNASNYLSSYLIPFSTDGIVNIVGGDFSLNCHELFIFYKENMRLAGRYFCNDTIRLIVNHEYVIVPKMEKGDIISSVKNLKDNSYIYTELIIGLGIVFLIAMLLLVVVVLIWRNRK